nr:uncharacterized protein LOC111426953 [Onthophagus taurus]
MLYCVSTKSDDMKSTFLTVFVFAQIFVCVLGFVCLQEHCKEVSCDEKLKCQLGSELRRNACSCCKSCVEVLGENQECALSNIILPSINPCAEGLFCLEGTCQNVGNLEEIQRVKDILNANA